jgi:hypothetical protein
VGELAAGLVRGLAVGLAVGLLFGLVDGASPPLLFAEVALRLRGRRVRFMPLLETALQRQVLRQAGVVYQFRHAALQDRLADRYRREHPGAVAAAGLAAPAAVVDLTASTSRKRPHQSGSPTPQYPLWGR